jgi:hypothetical protein
VNGVLNSLKDQFEIVKKELEWVKWKKIYFFAD